MFRWFIIVILIITFFQDITVMKKYKYKNAVLKESINKCKFRLMVKEVINE